MLSRREVAMALSKAAGFDNRHVTEAGVAAWAEGLSRWPNLTADEVLAAVTEHYAVSTDFMQVAHVYPAVKRIRERREVEESRARALTAAPSAPARDMWRDAHWDLDWFQEARMRARIRWCEEHGVPHDGDGWTAADRPSTALGGRVTAFDWR